MRTLIFVGLVLLVAALGCGDGETPVSPSGKASADCSLMEILSGKEGCAEDPSLDEVPDGYVPPADSTAAGDAGDGGEEEEPVDEPETDEPETEEPEVDDLDRTFDIEIRFLPPAQGSRDFTNHEKQVILNAAQRWEKKFLHGVPDAYISKTDAGVPTVWYGGVSAFAVPERIDDLLVFVYASDEDYLGWAYNVGAPYLPKFDVINPQPVGLVMLDIEKISSYYADDYYRFVSRAYTDIMLEDTAVHEIGHILQGSKWYDFVVRREDEAHYNGPYAIDQYDFLLQQSEIDYEWEGVPLINWSPSHWYSKTILLNGGKKDAEGWYRGFEFGAGWDFGAEIMSYASGVVGHHDVITRITLGALRDLGYPVDMSKSEHYRFTRFRSRSSFANAKPVVGVQRCGVR